LRRICAISSGCIRNRLPGEATSQFDGFVARSCTNGRQFISSGGREMSDVATNEMIVFFVHLLQGGRKGKLYKRKSLRGANVLKCHRSAHDVCTCLDNRKYPKERVPSHNNTNAYLLVAFATTNLYSLTSPITTIATVSSLPRTPVFETTLRHCLNVATVRLEIAVSRSTTHGYLLENAFDYSHHHQCCCCLQGRFQPQYRCCLCCHRCCP